MWEGNVDVVCGEVEGSLLSLCLLSVLPSSARPGLCCMVPFIWMPHLSWKKVEEDPNLLTSPPFLWRYEARRAYWDFDWRLLIQLCVLNSLYHRILFLSCSLLSCAPSTHNHEWLCTHACMPGYAHTDKHTVVTTTPNCLGQGWHPFYH